MPIIWEELQEAINYCKECKRLGRDLIAQKYEPPARPPSPTKVDVLFISEAPARGGGFYAPPSVKDDLREQLFDILRIPAPHEKGNINRFTSKGYFLVQTIKWPLKVSARQIRKNEKILIEHSVERHVSNEIHIIEPQIIIPLGKVACYACSRFFHDDDFDLKASFKLEEIRGKRFLIGPSGIPIFPTALPVRQNTKDIPRISKEIQKRLTFN